MKSISLYVDKRSPIHSIDPITKLWYIVFILALLVLFPHWAWIPLLVSLLLLCVAKVFQNALPVFGFVIFVLCTVVLIQGLFGVDNTTPIFSIGELTFYQEGLLRSLRIAYNVLNITSSLFLLVLTTKPTDLVETLVDKGLSPKAGYVVGSVFQIIPQMMASVDTIMDAQRSRGMETEGSLWLRIKAFIPLLGPVVLNAFINTKERSLALEARAFNAKNKKTFLHEQPVYPHRYVIRGGFVGLIVLAVLWRIML